MKKELNVADLVASITQEAEEKKALKKTAGLVSLKEKIRGSNLSKTAEDAKRVADGVASEIGRKTLPLSEQLEKVAAEMEKAETTEDIIKIAASLENSDLAYISSIATKLADVVIADIENKLSD